jgi:crotonobetainyl-CoA:carnitine CoA-transferase CaiB-like acyl-CoA transferase
MPSSDEAPVPSRLPLDDVRVLAVEQYGAGPWATMQLADLGAEVIKIEDPRSGGDVGRYVPPFQEGEDSLFFETFNGGKKSISLDLENHAGRETFLRLAERSDAVFLNLRGDLPARLGLRYRDLAHRNPKIVCCSLTGFGQNGPRAAAGALDYVIQGLAGWMSITGEPSGPPVRTGPSLVDFSGGYAAAIALLGALWRARRDGVGCDCDISLHETALALLSYVATWTATVGYEPVRRPNSAHLSIVPFQTFATADGWIVVACPKQALWEHFCRAIGCEELLGDPRYGDLAARDRNRDTLVPALADVLAARATAEWLEVLGAAGVPAGPINDVASALGDEQVAARNAIDTYVHDRLGEVRRVRSPLRLTGPRPEPRAAPSRGEHTASVLRDVCGIAELELEELDRQGAFGSTSVGAPR